MSIGPEEYGSPWHWHLLRASPSSADPHQEIDGDLKLLLRSLLLTLLQSMGHAGARRFDDSAARDLDLNMAQLVSDRFRRGAAPGFAEREVQERHECLAPSPLKSPKSFCFE